MNRYMVLTVGVLLVYLGMAGRLTKAFDVLVKPKQAKSGGGGSSGFE